MLSALPPTQCLCHCIWNHGSATHLVDGHQEVDYSQIQGQHHCCFWYPWHVSRHAEGSDLWTIYQELVDDPSNTNIGYSFISNHKNTCFEDHSQMVKAVSAGEGAFSNFLLWQMGTSSGTVQHCWAGCKTSRLFSCCHHSSCKRTAYEYMAALHKLLLVCAFKRYWVEQVPEVQNW